MADKASNIDVPADGDSAEHLATATGPMQADTPDELRWCHWRTIYATWLLPKTAASRMQHVSLPRAFLVHCCAAVAVFVLAVFLIAWNSSAYSYDIADAYREWLKLLVDLQKELGNSWPAVTLVVAGYTLAIEGVFLLIALIVSPWGAGNEPFRESIRNSVRHTWLHTTHFLPAVLIIGIVGVSIGTYDHWLIANAPALATPAPPVPKPIEVPKSDPSYAKLKAQHDVALQDYDVQIQRRRRELSRRVHRPWIVRHEVVGIVNAFVAMVLWLLWALLRAVGAARRFAPFERDPVCDFCGYNLTTIPMESRCPECGEAVVRSLGPNARPGTPWKKRGIIGGGWYQTSTLAFGHTKDLGRQLRLFPSDDTHRRFLMWSFPAAFVIGFAGVLILLVKGRVPRSQFLEILLVAGSVIGCLCVCGTAILVNFTALVVSAFNWSACRRNLMPGAVQIACYLVGYIWLYLIAGNLGMTWINMVSEERFGWMEWMAEAVHLRRDILALLLFLLGNATMLIFYVILVARGTAAMRYANR